MRADPAILVIFDTDCVLCSTWVRFVLRHERHEQIHFASSRKPFGQAAARAHGLTPEDLDLTYLVIRDGQALTKSDASLSLTREFKAPWRWLGVLRVVPRPLRDAIYDLVARNRLRWFGERKDCLLPSPEQRSRFLDHLPPHGEPAQGSQ